MLLKVVKKLFKNLLLVIFMLVFIGIFEFFFSKDSIYIAAFALTAVLMFSKINLQIPRKTAIIIFPVFFVLSVVIPYLINQLPYLYLNLVFIIGSVLLFLFFLSPSLSQESYVPFLYLYAINLNTTQVISLKNMILASFVGGVVTSIVYFLNHPKGEKDSTIKVLTKYFQNRISFVIKISLGIVLAYIIGYKLDYVKTSWIMLTVISLTEVDLANTHKKLWQRIVATIVGLIVYVIFLEKVVTRYPVIIPILLLIVTYVYTFVSDYFVKMIFVTFNSLNGAVMSMHLEPYTMIMTRFDFILLGAIVAIAIGWMYYLLHNYIRKNNRE